MARRTSVLLATALVLGGASAARATHQPSTASVDAHEVPAASTQTYELTVVHPGSGTAPRINQVRLVPPQHPGGALIAPIEATGPAQWQATVESDPPGVVFQSQQGLAAGQTGLFALTGQAATLAGDACGGWTVLVSSDGGQTSQAAGQAQPGDLATCVRVLEIPDLRLVAPHGAEDGSVTEGQVGVCSRMVVRNRGAADLVVLPGVTGTGSVPGVARAGDEEHPCQGPPLQDGSLVLPASSEAAVEFSVDFGDPGSASLQGTVIAPGAEALPRTIGVTVQPRATLQTLAATLTPRAVRPGTPGVTFSLTLSKGPAGSPGLTVEPSGSAFAFAGCGPVAPIAAVAFGPGNGNEGIGFAACDLLPLPDGRYPASLTVTTTDANGLASTDDVEVVDAVAIDGTAPTVLAEVTLPPGPPGAATGAVKNGATVALSGTVRDADPDTGEQAPCPGCQVEAELEQTDGAGLPVGTIPVPVTRNGGSFSGSYAGAYHADARAACFRVRARDEAGNTVEAQGTCFEVDNVKPRILSATAVRVDGQQNRVHITLSECVFGSTGVLDWRVTSNVVTAVSGPQCQASTGRTTFTLTTVLPMADDGPHGEVDYAPPPIVGGVFEDAARNVMDPQVAPIDDGIPPGMKKQRL